MHFLEIFQQQVYHPRLCGLAVAMRCGDVQKHPPGFWKDVYIYILGKVY